MSSVPVRAGSESGERSLKELPRLKADVHIIGTNEQLNKVGEKRISLKTKNILERELQR